MRFFTLSALLLVVAGAVPAQQTAPDSTPAVTFRTDSRLVVLNVSVLGPDGKIVNGIPQSAFKVFEDSQLQHISVFRQEDVPVSMGLIIDNSASMKEKRARVTASTLAMVKASNPQDEVFVIHFNEEPTLVQDFTSNLRQLEMSLDKIQSSGETAMYDAVRLGIEHLRRGKKDKKVLVVVTDGEDNSSIGTLPRVVQAAHQADVIVYGIGLLGTEEPRSAERARKALEELTASTGGRAWFPAEAGDITTIMPEIAHEIRNQYIVGYTPTNLASDGSFRKVRVEVDYPNVQVHTRSGYYAPRD